MTDTTDIGELPTARVYCTDAGWWYYSIECGDPAGPFRSSLAAGRACRDELVALAEGRTP